MVRFRRLRIRSPLKGSPEVGEEATCLKDDVDVSKDSLIPETAKENTSDGTLRRRGSSLKELEHKERQLTAEEEKLQSILQQVEDAEKEQLAKPVDMKSNRRTDSTSSTKSTSSVDSVSVSLTRSEAVQTPTSEMGKLPLWKRKLSRIQEKAVVQEKIAKEVDSSFETSNSGSSESAPSSNQPQQIAKIVDPPSPIELENTRTGYSLRQSMTEEMAPVEEDEILDAPVGLPRVVFSEVKNDESSIMSPEIYGASRASYRPGSGDSVSSLGHDDYQDPGQPDVCNMQNLARDVIREAALLFLEFDSQCNDQPLHVPRRPTN